jgi:hypothetical protein
MLCLTYSLGREWLYNVFVKLIVLRKAIERAGVMVTIEASVMVILVSNLGRDVVTESFRNFVQHIEANC